MDWLLNLLPSRKREKARQIRLAETAEKERAAFRRFLDENDYLSYMDFLPPKRPVWMVRYEWDGPLLKNRSDFPPWFNVAGLYWREGSPIKKRAPSQV